MKHIAKIIGESNLVTAFEDLFHVSVNLRGYTKEFEHRYGGEAKRRKKYWEDRMDELILKLGNGAYAEKNIEENLETKD